MRLGGSPTPTCQLAVTLFLILSLVILGSSPVTVVAAKQFTTLFEVRTPLPSIVQVELEMGTTEFEAIDDLEFEGEAPSPLPTQAPVVQLTSPANDDHLDVAAITIQGTVTGDGLLPTAQFILEYPRPPWAPASSPGGLVLSETGRTRTFAVPSLTIGLGPQVFAVEAKNTAGLKGSAQVRFTNLPGAIRTRFTAEAGATTFGDFSFDHSGGGCKMAVYQRGSIALVGTSTFVARGLIFDKWLSVRDQFGVPRLGCPTAEVRSHPDGTSSQDFAQGRIYAGLPTGTHYVPPVFVQAIDRLGGEAATSLPISDPSKSIGVMQTWLFQGFRGSSGQAGLPVSTLEIRETPPTLWVERQGGHVSQLPNAPLVGTSTPTLWQRFPCSSNEGPCNVSEPTSGPPLENAGNRFCEGTTYPWGPPEWKAVVDNYALTPILGIVKESHMAGKDNPLTHEMSYAPCISITTAVEEGSLDDGQCRSDWNVLLLPLHPHRNLFANNRDTVELEWEDYYSRAWFLSFNADPKPGDLLFASGRWIIDCGHSNYHSEIHPPAVIAPMRTETYKQTPADSGRPATLAHIWVNGWYTGDPVELDIFPPPRPSPDTRLVVIKPKDADAVLGVNIQYSFVADMYVRLRFSASSRRPQVTDAGEMKWGGAGRDYRGIWYLFWDAPPPRLVRPQPVSPKTTR